MRSWPGRRTEGGWSGGGGLVLAEDEGAGRLGLAALEDAIVDAWEKMGFDPAGGADPGLVGDQGHAVHLAQQPPDLREMPHLLAERRKIDMHPGADIGEHVHFRRRVH